MNLEDFPDIEVSIDHDGSNFRVIYTYCEVFEKYNWGGVYHEGRLLRSISGSLMSRLDDIQRQINNGESIGSYCPYGHGRWSFYRGGFASCHWWGDCVLSYDGW